MLQPGVVKGELWPYLVCAAMLQRMMCLIPVVSLLRGVP